MKLEKLTIKEEHISLHKNSIYFSSRLRKDRGFEENDRFQFLYDKESRIVVVFRVGDKVKNGGVRMNKGGYCKTRINKLLAHGRYYLEQEKRLTRGKCLIFKYKKV